MRSRIYDIFLYKICVELITFAEKVNRKTIID
nr:MAG TPA: hypothetical protein [Caudoviricetes sp.]